MSFRKFILPFLIILCISAYSSAQGLIKQEFYENGKIRLSVFKDGDNYRYLAFYESGKLMERGKYTEGLRHGKFERWFESGARQVDVTFTKDCKDGIYTVWNENGRVLLKASFNNGQLQNGSIWDDGGNLVASR